MSETMTSIKSIVPFDVSGLVTMLSNNGKLHNNYYHYTDISSVIGMVRSHKFHLSQGDRMNDRNEIQKGSWEEWQKIYISSFNFGTNENMGLWGLYSIPWQDGVRIEIPRKAMLKWLNLLRSGEGSIYSVKWLDGIGYDYERFDAEYSIDLADVVYIENDESDPRKYQLKYDRDSISIDYRIDRERQITGYIKNSVWKYENEVRIRLRLNEESYHVPKQIAIDFPDEVIESCTIRACPWFEGDIQQRIEEVIGEFCFKGQGNSRFSRLVEMKTACSKCRHDHFNPKD